VIVLDKLTYAGNPDNLLGLEDDPHYLFVKGDICDAALVDKVISEEKVDTIVNFAAETHVDRSLMEPGAFIMTDVFGTYVLLEAAKEHGIEKIIQVSTDEVYGEVKEGSSRETDPLAPRSPYSASKAGGDMMARAYWISHGVPVVITRASNNVGPYQHPEKLVPLFVTNAIDDLPLPVYGDGLQVRDWLYVTDHCAAIDLLLDKGQPGEVYNIGGDNERENLRVAEAILELLAKPRDLIRHVTDRPGHDRRYSVHSGKIKGLGWQPAHGFEEAITKTVRWYRDNEWWWRKIKSGEYAEYYQQNYGHRETLMLD
jgi:dTDP-glucose 4,6-dehydratase